MNKLSPLMFAATFVAGLSGLLFGYDTGLIADVQTTVMAKFGFSAWQWGAIVSVTVIGAFFSALLSGLLIDRYGRRNTLRWVAVGFVVGSFVLVVATGFYSLFFGRLIIGMSIGVASYAAPLYIAELAPSSMRGALVLVNGMTITGGEALAFLMGYGVMSHNHDGWRFVFATAIIPAVLLLCGMIYMPCSPRWLLRCGDDIEALRVLKQLRVCHSIASNELKQIKKTIVTGLTTQRCVNPKRLLSKPMRILFLIGVVLGIGQQFSGINTIMYYGPHIFQLAGFGAETSAIFATFIMGLVNMVGTMVALLFVDWLGRRRLLVVGLVICAVALVVVASIFHSSQHHPDLLFISMLTYIFAYALSIGSLFWLIIAEIYPLPVRGLAMSVVTAVQWLANFVVALLFLPVLARIGASLVFYLFSVSCAVVAIFSYYCVPETRAKTLDV